MALGVPKLNRFAITVQVKDNLCGKCTKYGTSGFKLEESKAGLRFNGASFDDNQIGASFVRSVWCPGVFVHTAFGIAGKGTMQAKNICILAKFGNGGTITDTPTSDCEGKSISGPASEVHWCVCSSRNRRENVCFVLCAQVSRN